MDQRLEGWDGQGDAAQVQVKLKDGQDQMDKTPGQLKDNECRMSQ